MVAPILYLQPLFVAKFSFSGFLWFSINEGGHIQSSPNTKPLQRIWNFNSRRWQRIFSCVFSLPFSPISSYCAALPFLFLSISHKVIVTHVMEFEEIAQGHFWVNRLTSKKAMHFHPGAFFSQTWPKIDGQRNWSSVGQTLYVLWNGMWKMKQVVNRRNVTCRHQGVSKTPKLTFIDRIAP